MTIMNIFTLYLYSINKTQKVIFDNIDKVIIDDIWNTLMRKCKVEHYMNTCGARLIYCKQTRQALIEVQQKYDIITKRTIRKLLGLTTKMEEGEAFYVFDSKKATIVERKTAIEVLKIAPNGRGWITVHNKIFYGLTLLSTTFEMHSFGYDNIPISVGEKDPTKRKCRFCGETSSTKFHDSAHAIQDSLGNKLLICNEECDTCNHTLNAVEDNFLHLMDVRRAMYRIARKETTKVPHIVGSNYVIQPNSNGDAELYLMREDIKSEIDINNKFWHRLNHKVIVTNEGIFKALVKIVIDLIPSKELIHFKNTINWLISKEKWIPDALPSLLFAVIPGNRMYRQPVVDIFINNKKQLINSPYCTAILYIYDAAYMFIVPFVDIDSGKYKYDNNLTSHWEYMMQFFHLSWIKQDTSDWHASIPWIDWEIDPTNPNVHILPQTNTIFKDCLKQKEEPNDINFTQFTPSGINVLKIEHTIFENYYSGPPLSNKDLSDITLHINGLIFILNPKDQSIQFIIKLDIADTTDTIEYCHMELDITFHLIYFCQYVDIEYDEEGYLESFAIDYHLCEYLFKRAMEEGEQKLYFKRLNSYFKNCTLTKLINYSERLITQSIYGVPNGNQGMKWIPDKLIHR